MISPIQLVKDIVAKLQRMDALVAQLGGDPHNVRGFYDRWPIEASLLTAFHEAATGTILVFHDGTSQSGGSAFSHRVGIYFRPQELVDAAPETGAAALLELLVETIPNGDSVKFIYGDFYGSVNFAGLEFSYQQDEEGIRYPFLVLTFTEAGISG